MKRKFATAVFRRSAIDRIAEVIVDLVNSGPVGYGDAVHRTFLAEQGHRKDLVAVTDKFLLQFYDAVTHLKKGVRLTVVGTGPERVLFPAASRR